MTTWSIHRRTFLQAAMALPLLWLRPGWLSLLRAADTSNFSERSHKRERILLLVELQGEMTVSTRSSHTMTRRTTGRDRNWQFLVIRFDSSLPNLVSIQPCRR